jgi:hypothetical protein
MSLIPKKIMTMWLALDPAAPLPKLVDRCIESQKLPGYEHKLITMDNCYKGSRYVNEALAKAKETGKVSYLVKASDWLRCWHMYEDGGIYLDADMEVLPGKNFDDMLDDRFFTEAEAYGFYANAGFGCEPHHPLMMEYCERVERNFRGDGDMTYEPGIKAFADMIWACDKAAHGIKLYDSKVFFPYQHGTEIINVSPLTRVYHHYTNSWCGDNRIKKIGTDYEDKDFTDIFAGKANTVK